MSHTAYPRTMLKHYLDLQRSPYKHVSRRPTFSAQQLVAEQIAFNAGTHEDAIRMQFHDLARTMKPAFCGQP